MTPQPDPDALAQLVTEWRAEAIRLDALGQPYWQGAGSPHPPEWIIATELRKRADQLASALLARSGERASDGVSLIAAERKRQVSAEGWTAFHDDSEHHQGELVSAAICYAEAGSGFDLEISARDGDRPTLWPWEPSSWKPSDDLVRNLVKAGALIAAEIDRLRRETTGDTASSPVLAFQSWLERYVSDHQRKLTQDEYFLAQAAFFSAHPGKGPTSTLMEGGDTAPAVPPDALRQFVGMVQDWGLNPALDRSRWVQLWEILRDPLLALASSAPLAAAGAETPRKSVPPCGLIADEDACQFTMGHRGPHSWEGAETPTPDPEHAEWIRSQCNVFKNGQCSTRSCLLRGGWDGKTVPITARPTCIEREIAELIGAGGTLPTPPQEQP